MTTTLTLDAIADAIDFGPPDTWGGQCHAVSHALVRSGLVGEPGPECRVVRGTGLGVGSQHSWVVVGDPFDPASRLIDPTAFGWGAADGLVVTTVGASRYTAFGYDPRDIWEFGRPARPEPGTAVDLEADLPERAESFLRILGPLDLDGWYDLARYPMGGWPAREIIRALVADDGPIGEHVRAMLPIDVASLRGDWNPKGLYW